MTQVNLSRLALLIGGLIAVALSVALQGGFATDSGPSLAGPGAIAIIAVAGVVSIALAVLRGKG